MSIPTHPRTASPSVPDSGPLTDDRQELAPSDRRLRILLADDSAVARIFAARLLEVSGHQVDLVTDGRQAVDAARSAVYDLILMDVHMPAMDGIQATMTLRAGGCTLPILALSGTADRDDLQDCLDAGMNGALEKPFTLDAFRHECLRLRRRAGDSDDAASH
jgi:CheY-like chemotaxis protein